MASRMRLVTAASPDKTVHPSMNGSSGAPTPPIWIMWSIAENQTKPWFSAHRAFALTPSKASVGTGPNTHDGLWIPNFIEIAPVLSVPQRYERSLPDVGDVVVVWPTRRRDCRRPPSSTMGQLSCVRWTPAGRAVTRRVQDQKGGGNGTRIHHGIIGRPRSDGGQAPDRTRP